MLLFQVFFDPKVVQVLQHLSELVKLHGTCLCKAELSRLSVPKKNSRITFLPTEQIITTAHVHISVALWAEGEPTLE